MKIRRPRKRKPYVPVSSFGDIAFLLIIFFMVSSVFMREAHIKADEAGSPDIEELDELRVSVVLDKEGALWLQGQPCPFEALAARVERLLGDAEGENRRVALRIDRKRTHDEFGKVLMALSEVGAEIVLIGRREE